MMALKLNIEDQTELLLVYTRPDSSQRDIAAAFAYEPGRFSHSAYANFDVLI